MWKTLFAVAAATASTARNILFMLEDDGSMDLGVFGNNVIGTPNVDALAAAGTTFDNAYTTVSSCSPSRASIMSGLPTHQSGQYGLQHAQEHFSSFDGVQSIENVLTQAGYATGIVGKYHVWPQADYNFTWGNSPTGPGGCRAGASSACPTTDYNLVARNITYMKEAFQDFLAFAGSAPWFFYVGFGDSHRCGGAMGEFCELYGIDNKTGASTIPDWTPHTYKAEEVVVPYWIQDTPVARADIAHMYTAKNRMDQGVGLMMEVLQKAGQAEDTLVIYFADNGAPFAAGKTNFYTPGMIEPLVVSVPGKSGGVRSTALASSLDLFPTWLEWAGLPLPKYSLLGEKVEYTGKSLLPYLGQGAPGAYVAEDSNRLHPLLRTYSAMVAASAEAEQEQQGEDGHVRVTAQDPTPLPANYSRVHGSFQLHEIQEYYPMRVVVASTVPPSVSGGEAVQAGGIWPTAASHYKLIYNIAHWLPYPIASDLWSAPSMQDLVNRTDNGQATHWYRNFSAYLSTPRPLFELYDLSVDPMEMTNVAQDPAYATVLQTLQADILAWQKGTNDDWLIKRQHE